MMHSSRLRVVRRGVRFTPFLAICLHVWDYFLSRCLWHTLDALELSAELFTLQAPPFQLADLYSGLLC